MSNRKILIFVFLTMCGAICAQAQLPISPKPLSPASLSAARRLRDLYMRRDYETASEEGGNLTAQFPKNVELQAWYLTSMARVGMSEQAAVKAQKLTEDFRNEGWAWFALANVLNKNAKYAEAETAAENALKIDSSNEEFILAYASVLMAQKKYKEVYDLLDRSQGKIKDKSRWHVARGETIYREGRGDVAFVKRSLDEFAEAVKINPQNVTANYVYGSYLNFNKQAALSYPILKKTVRLSPASIQIHQEFWKSIQGQSDKTDIERNAEIAADVKFLLRSRKPSPQLLAAAAEEFDRLKDEANRNFYENQIVQKYPATKYAEEIAYSRIKRFQMAQAKSIDPEVLMKALNKTVLGGKPTDLSKNEMFVNFQKSQENLKAMRRDFIKRPIHFDEAKLGSVYLDLLKQFGSDKTVTDEELNNVIAGALKYKKPGDIQYNLNGLLNVETDRETNINSEIAKVLSARRNLKINSRFNSEVEKFAQAGVESAEKLAADANQKITNPERRAENTNRFRANALRTYGEILLGSQKNDEAEQKLLEADRIYPDDFGTNLLLALVYVQKKEFEKAEERYLSISSGREMETGWFKQLYLAKNGKPDGTDEYLNNINAKIAVKRKALVLESRFKEPVAAAGFKLQTIDGKTVSYDELKGKIIVINVWGTWCAPCALEMPEFQQLYAKYKNDSEIAILSFDANDSPEQVKSFLTKKNYNFPVLLADSYLPNIMSGGDLVFPTTLFIDRSGKVAFIKKGNTPKLLDEFSWRIDALKADK